MIPAKRGSLFESPFPLVINSVFSKQIENTYVHINLLLFKTCQCHLFKSDYHFNVNGGWNISEFRYSPTIHGILIQFMLFIYWEGVFGFPDVAD